MQGKAGDRGDKEDGGDEGEFLPKFFLVLLVPFVPLAVPGLAPLI